MNVYDFDGTIYDGDCSVDFFLYALKSKPLLLRYLPRQIKGFILYRLKKINKTELKEFFFSFLNGVDAENLIQEFWNQNYQKIYSWYILQQRADDIIISASPDFLLRPICQRLKIKYFIASKVDSASGKFDGKNCKGKEKVQRLKEEYNITHIDKFYTDSESDLPLAEIADKSFIIKNGIVTEWQIF